jgi:hypothetical protein
VVDLCQAALDSASERDFREKNSTGQRRNGKTPV